jgi:hypothetical protein
MESLSETDPLDDASPRGGTHLLIGLRKWIIGGLILAIIVGLYWRLSSRTHVLGEAYVADQTVALWSTLAQVHQRAGEAHWGDRVEILKRSNADTFVRTTAGLEGWMDGRALIDEADWQREVKLQSTAHAIPIQATGHTKVFTNIRLEAGRDATRIYQLTGGVPLAIVGRAAIEVPATPSVPSGGSSTNLGAAPASSKTKSSKTDERPKTEDWVLIYPIPPRPASGGGAPQTSTPGSAQGNQGDMVMGRDPAQRQSGGPGAQKIPPLAGWVLARFIELDLPETLRDYATSAGMRPVAWFVLNYVSDDAEGKPQYLMAGNHGGSGGESEACDFNSLRVYTYGATRRRYETAYVEGNLCGFFPIRVAKQARTGDPEFRFNSLDSGGTPEERVYTMHQTSVRRIRELETSKPSAPAKSPKSAKANSKSKSH